MCSFYFDIVDADGECIDEEGLDLPDLDSARSNAIAGIRSILSCSVRRGSFSLEGRVNVRNGAGETVLVVPFREAVVIS